MPPIEERSVRRGARRTSSMSSSPHSRDCTSAITCLAASERRPENVLADELYAEMSEKGVPLRERPNWIMSRMSGGEPLSKWL